MTVSNLARQMPRNSRTLANKRAPPKDVGQALFNPDVPITFYYLTGSAIIS